MFYLGWAPGLFLLQDGRCRWIHRAMADLLICFLLFSSVLVTLSFSEPFYFQLYFLSHLLFRGSFLPQWFSLQRFNFIVILQPNAIWFWDLFYSPTFCCLKNGQISGSLSLYSIILALSLSLSFLHYSHIHFVHNIIPFKLECLSVSISSFKTLYTIFSLKSVNWSSSSES